MEVSVAVVAADLFVAVGIAAVLKTSFVAAVVESNSRISERDQ